MYQLHPSSVSVGGEGIPGGKTATLPLFNQAERTRRFLAFLGSPSGPKSEGFCIPRCQEPALPYRAPVFHPCVDTVTRRDASTCMPVLLQNTKGRIQTPKMIMFFYFCYSMCFFKDYRFSGRHVLLAEMQSFSDAEVARVI